SIIRKYGNDEFHIVIEKQPATVKIHFKKNNEHIIVPEFFKCKCSKSELNVDELTEINPLIYEEEEIDKKVNNSIYNHINIDENTDVIYKDTNNSSPKANQI
ncbi:10001_t:CDS:2, partial [Racocetra fulgida]